MLHPNSDRISLLDSFRQTLTHVVVTTMAFAIAISLPPFARYILYDWWPRVESHPNLLLATEITVASVIVILTNLARTMWSYRDKVEASRRAALVYARDPGRGWMARWRERALLRRLPAARDALIVSKTGYDVLVAPCSPLRGAIERAREIRVVLANPFRKNFVTTGGSLLESVTPRAPYCEIAASIVRLKELRCHGKSVALKFCDSDPFWKVTIVGDHAWIHHSCSPMESKRSVEYVFALDHSDPQQGLYLPFCGYALKEWSAPSHAEYDFDRDELISRDQVGKELARTALAVPTFASGSDDALAREIERLGENFVGPQA